MRRLRAARHLQRCLIHAAGSEGRHSALPAAPLACLLTSIERRGGNESIEARFCAVPFFGSGAASGGAATYPQAPPFHTSECHAALAALAASCPAAAEALDSCRRAALVNVVSCSASSSSTHLGPQPPLPWPTGRRALHCSAERQQSAALPQGEAVLGRKGVGCSQPCLACWPPCTAPITLVARRLSCGGAVVSQLCCVAALSQCLTCGHALLLPHLSSSLAAAAAARARARARRGCSGSGRGGRRHALRHGGAALGRRPLSAWCGGGGGTHCGLQGGPAERNVPKGNWAAGT